jgi:hypothetical protein
MLNVPDGLSHATTLRVAPRATRFASESRKSTMPARPLLALVAYDGELA